MPQREILLISSAAVVEPGSGVEYRQHGFDSVKLEAFQYSLIFTGFGPCQSSWSFDFFK